MATPSSPTTQRPARTVDDDLREVELGQPDVLTVFGLIWRSVRDFFRERPGQIMGSAFILIMLWGYHGKLELLGLVWPAWEGPGVTTYAPGERPSAFAGLVPWDLEIISFWTGALLLVVVPILIIRFGFKAPLSGYGLGLPPRGRRRLAFLGFLVLTLGSLPGFFVAAGHEEMQALYPYFRPFPSLGSFVLYQLSVVPFYLAIEFIFRGYLLFGLAGVRDREVPGAGGGVAGALFFGRYALLIQMLSYTAWHLGKPLPELWGTLVWGLAAGAVAYAVRSIWPIVLAHWGLNVVMDILILRRLDAW